MKTGDFYEQVYDLVREIPFGRVCSYGLIGASLGAPRSARLVGYAMNMCHGLEPIVPAHRVVNAKGLLTGYMHFATPTLMQELLENEGILVKKMQVQDFQEKLWNPLKDL